MQPVPTFDISVRHSRDGNRDRDRIYTDDNQESACRAQAEKEGGTVGIVTVEKNVSGGKAAVKRQIEKLIKRVEDGLSNGIIVYDFTRFSREDPFKAMILVGRVANAGGVVIGVADNYRSDAPMAAVMTAIYAEQAHNYIKVTREKSKDGVASARAKGIYIGRTPQCYDRDEHGMLIEGERAGLIDKIFKRKLAGDSYADLVRLSAEHGLILTHGGIRKILSNRVYIGESPNGPSPALTDKETFERVQQMKRPRKPIGAGARTLAQGIAHCANCGKTLVLTKSKDTMLYYCRGLGLGGCDARANVSVGELDEWINSLFESRAKLVDRIFRAHSDEDATVEIGKLMDTKRFEYESLKGRTSLISTVGIDEFEKMVTDAKAGYDIAVAAYAEAQATADLLSGATSVLMMWADLTLEEKRRLLPKLISRIEVGTGRVPIEEKCRIVLSGETVLPPDDPWASLPFVQNRDELAS